MAQQTPAMQRTLADAATVRGRGLFTGQQATVTFKPAPVNHGVVCYRTDITDSGVPARIPALIQHVAKRDRRTTLKLGDATIDTCEHVMSAVAGLGIDNLIVEIDGPEFPGVDGSAKPFVEAMLAAGLAEQDQPRRVFTITDPVTIEENGAMIAALPADTTGMEVIYDLEYSDGPIGHQVHAYSSNNGSYKQQIAPARTFLLEHEARAFQAQGLGKHLTPTDLLVIGDSGVVGENAYRFDNEPARHKLLDVIGDLQLVGCAIRGRIVAYRSGHALNHRLARKLHQMMATHRRRELLRKDGEVDIRRISRLLPHRYPMLLIDRVLEVEGDQRATAVKNVTVNEPFFQGHFPGTPIMPGVLIVEAMAQLSGVLLSRKLEHTGKLAVLLSMDKVKLRKPVTPGDQLVIEAQTVRVRSRTGHTICKAYVADQLAAEAEIKFMLVDAEQE